MGIVYNSRQGYIRKPSCPFAISQKRNLKQSRRRKNVSPKQDSKKKPRKLTAQNRQFLKSLGLRVQ